MAARLPKKAKGYALHGFFTRGEHLTNDMDNGPCHLPDIPYDMFYVTACHVSTRHAGVEIWAGTASQGKWQLYNQDQRSWLCIHQCKKVSCTILGKIPLHSPLDSCHTPLSALITGINVLWGIMLMHRSPSRLRLVLKANSHPHYYSRTSYIISHKHFMPSVTTSLYVCTIVSLLE